MTTIRPAKAASILVAAGLASAALAEPAPGDRVYTADQSSNTVSVIDPVANEVLGTIALGDRRIESSLAPVDAHQENVHGLGISPDGRRLVVVSVSSNAVQIVDTVTNAVLLTTYVGRSPHEAAFAPDGRSVWVAVRGEAYVAVVDAETGEVTARIETAPGPSKVVFSPDGTRAYVNHLTTNELAVIDVPSLAVTDRIAIPEAAGGSADFAVSPDGAEVWLGHPASGMTTVIDTATLTVRAVLDTGPRTNHPNFATVDGVDYAYVTVGGLGQTKVFRRTEDGEPELVATIENSGAAPHGVWPSPDGTRLYVALQKSDAVDVIDTATNAVIETLRIGQDPQALVYVAGAVPEGQDGAANLTRQGLDGRVENLAITIPDVDGAKGSANVRSLDGLDEIDITASGLAPDTTYTVFGTSGETHRALRSVTSNARGGVDEALAFAAFFGSYDAVVLLPEGEEP